MCPPAPLAVHLRSPLGLLRPWDSAERSVWGVASVHQVSTSTRVTVSEETTALASIADTPTSQEKVSSRDATSGRTLAPLFLSVLLLLVLIRSTLSLFFTLFSVCRAGHWQCTGEKCAVQCRLMGALQVTTFDKKSYTLQGGDCPFTAVEVRTWLCVCVCVSMQ